MKSFPTIPGAMKTGRSKTGGHTLRDEGLVRNEIWRDAFIESAKREASRQGFSFFAGSLANASRLAGKVLELMWTIHGTKIIGPLMVEICNNLTRQQTA